MESQKKFFFNLQKPQSSVFMVFSFLFFLKFLYSVGFQAFSGLSGFHFGWHRRPLRLVSYKEGKASLLIFFGYAQQVSLGQASSVPLLECLLVLERKEHLLFLEEGRVELQLQSPKGLKPPMVWSAQAQGRFQFSRLSSMLALPEPLPSVRVVEKNEHWAQELKPWIQSLLLHLLDDWTSCFTFQVLGFSFVTEAWDHFLRGLLWRPSVTMEVKGM